MTLDPLRRKRLQKLLGMVELPAPLHREDNFLTLRQAQALCKQEGVGTKAAYERYRAGHRGCGLPFEPHVHYDVTLRVG